MRLFLAAYVFTALLVLGLLHVQSLVLGVWTCGVDPVTAALAETGRPPVVAGETAAACEAGSRTPSPTVSGWDALPPLVAPPCIPGGTIRMPVPSPEAHRWTPRMPNAVDVDCERLQREGGAVPIPGLLVPHRPPSAGTAGTTLRPGTRPTGRS